MFLCTIRRPPRSTLFPTRRSSDLGPVNIAPENAAFAWDLGSYQYTRYKKAKRKPATLQVDASARVTDMLQVAEAARDRKSTRLNSSHVEISYAVFCLKKKTKKIDY